MAIVFAVVLTVVEDALNADCGAGSIATVGDVYPAPPV